MSLNHGISEEELKALLGPSRDKAEAADSHMPAEQAESAFPTAMSQEAELLHALKDVVKTLTVRVASLESEVGRLRAELTAAKRGIELPPAEERIVVEGVTLPALPAEQEAAASSEAAQRGPMIASAPVLGAGVSAAPALASTSAVPALSAPASFESAAAALTTRASRHRKPKKKGFFSRLFD